MSDPDQKPDETYSEEETKRRAEATLKVMLATPHKPHAPLGKRLPKAKGKGATGCTTAPRR